MHRWTITQDRSVASVKATDHAGASTRGAAIGFSAPTSIVQDDDQAIYRRRVAELQASR